ncbi:MAG: helix-turn-helix domain-containing protein [Rhodocyclales bacterium]|nr:helix-turn-helix domain-containing protein [Rhodocyclales bacterium]
MNNTSPQSPSPLNQGHLLANNEAAAYLGVAPQTLTIWRCVKRYAIPYIKVGSRIRYRREDLDAWLASRTVGTQAGAAA